MSAIVAGTTTPTVLGQLTMTRFVNKAGLQPIGDNLFLETPASGTPQDGQANTDGYGDLQQGNLEQANVEAVTEISDLIAAQRAYEMNAKVISAGRSDAAVHVGDDALRRPTMIRLATLSLLALTLPAAAQIAGAQVAGTNGSFLERFSAHAPLSQRTGPTLKPAVTIVGEIVRIGDLVENAGAAANVPIFRAPDLGQTGRVAVERVIEAVLPHEIVDHRDPRPDRSRGHAREHHDHGEGHRGPHHAGARRPSAQHRREQPHADLRQRSPHHPHRAAAPSCASRA